MASTACFVMVSRNDSPIYETEVGTAPKVTLLCLDNCLRLKRLNQGWSASLAMVSEVKLDSHFVIKLGIRACVPV